MVSGYLGTLVARSTGGPSLRPRRASRFEPAPVLGGQPPGDRVTELDSETDEPEVKAAPARITRHDSGPDGGNEVGASPAMALDNGPVPGTREAPLASTPAPRPSAPIAVTAPHGRDDVTAGSPTAIEHESSGDELGARAIPSRRAGPQPGPADAAAGGELPSPPARRPADPKAMPPPLEPALAMGTRGRRSADGLSEPSLSRLPPRNSPRPSPQVEPAAGDLPEATRRGRRLQPPPPATGLRPQPLRRPRDSPSEGVDGPRRPAPREPDTVHVSIGRIEVRVAAPTPPPKPAARARPRPTRSLEDYIHARGTGGVG
jgi:hypothetical protein